MSVSVSDTWLNEYENGRLTDNMDRKRVVLIMKDWLAEVLPRVT